MAAELYDQGNDQSPPPESPVMETPQAELWNKDVQETGRWGTRSRKEVYIVIFIALLMIGATAAGVAIAVKNSKKTPESTEPVGNTKIDPVTGKLVSAYEFPVPAAPTIISDQEELDLILAEISSISIVSGSASALPKTVAEVASAAAGSTDPYVQAAFWLTTTDTVNAKEFALTRLALAVTYYTDGGANWKNSTNWLSTSYHCDWFGVTCCEHVIASAMCRLDSFGRVIELDLFRNNLVGPLSESVLLLPFLQTLYFSENSLTGTLPGEVIASFKNFSKLYLAYNYFTGVIPSELASAPHLNTMFLQGNNFTGEFPKDLCPCGGCKDGLLFFGVDCDKIDCGVDCCERANNCFYMSKMASLEITDM